MKLFVIATSVLLVSWACAKGDGLGNKRSGVKGAAETGDEAASDGASSEEAGGDTAGTDNDGTAEETESGASTDESTAEDDSAGDDAASSDDGTNDADEGTADSEEQPPTGCAGKSVGGGCWYLGTDGQSCTQVCGAHNGYNELTRTFAGDSGTSAQCKQIVVAVVGNTTSNVMEPNGSEAIGCMSFPDLTHFRRYMVSPTTADGSQAGTLRFCACNN